MGQWPQFVCLQLSLPCFGTPKLTGFMLDTYIYVITFAISLCSNIVVSIQCYFREVAGSILLEWFCRLDQLLKTGDFTFHLVYELLQMYTLGRNTYLVSGPYILCCSEVFLAIYKPRLWRWKRRFEARSFQLLANEGNFECSGPPALITRSGASPVGHLGC